MRVGIDSYSYHRLFGEVRVREEPHPGPLWPPDPTPILEHARRLGVDEVYLETCYLTEPEQIDAETLAPAGPVEVGFSWGHPWPEGAFHGLEGGRTPAAEDQLERWIALCARLDKTLMRITLGTAASRGNDPGHLLVDRLVGPTRRVADMAADVGVTLAIENHGDMRAAEIMEVIDRVDRPNLGVTLDNLNLPRVGDDMLAGTRLLAPRTLLVQLNDHDPTEDLTIESGATCTALGEGVAPNLEVLEILDEAGYEGAICVEIATLPPEPVDELAMIERSVSWLRAHVPDQPASS